MPPAITNEEFEDHFGTFSIIIESTDLLDQCK